MEQIKLLLQQAYEGLLALVGSNTTGIEANTQGVSNNANELQTINSTLITINDRLASVEQSQQNQTYEQMQALIAKNAADVAELKQSVALLDSDDEMLNGRIDALLLRVQALEQGTPVDPDPDPDPTYSVEFILLSGVEGEDLNFEGKITGIADSDIEYVDMKVNGLTINREKNAPYTSTNKMKTPAGTFNVGVGIKIVGDDTLYNYEGSLTATPAAPGGGGTGSAGWAGNIGQYDSVILVHDGDTQDPDDIAAVVVNALLAKSYGITDKTYMFVGNNINQNDTPGHVTGLRNSLNFAQGLGITGYDFTTEDGWMDEMAEYVRLLSTGKVLVLEGGPMAAAHYAMANVPVEQHSNITMVSHSNWNESWDAKNVSGGIPKKKWADLKADYPGVNFIDISDQNAGFNNPDWVYLKDSSAEELNRAWTAMEKAGYKDANKQYDASDAGMLYMAITGNEFGKPLDTKTIFEATFDPVLPGDPTLPEFYKLESGFYGIMAEDMAPQNPLWVVEDAELVSKYITFQGSDSFQQWNAATKLCATVQVQESGVYMIRAYNKNGDLNDHSQMNDTWVRIVGEGGQFYAQKGGTTKTYAKGNAAGLTPVTVANDSSEGAFKFYSSKGQGMWTTDTFAVDGQSETIFVVLEEGKNYLFEISGRSRGHSIQSFFLNKVGVNPNVIDKYLPAMKPVDPPTDPGNVPSGIEVFDDFVANSNGTWYNWKASEFSTGQKDTDFLKQVFNSGDAKMGAPGNRLNVDDHVVGGETVRSLNVAVTTDSDGYTQRLSVPKDFTYVPVDGAVATEIEFMTLPGPKTGNFDDDRKTLVKNFHFKGGSLRGKSIPSPGSNPQGGNAPQEGKKFWEVVLFSGYGPAAMERDGKGDAHITMRGQKSVFSKKSTLNQMNLDWGSDAFNERFFAMNLALYSANSFTYNYQEQVYPCLPNPDGSLSFDRFLFEVGEKYTMRVIMKPNTFNADGSYNKDGQLFYWLQTDKVNGGEPWLCAYLDNWVFTTVPDDNAKTAKAGLGIYINPGDAKALEGFHFIKQALYY